MEEFSWSAQLHICACVSTKHILPAGCGSFNITTLVLSSLHNSYGSLLICWFLFYCVPAVDLFCLLQPTLPLDIAFSVTAVRAQRIVSHPSLTRAVLRPLLRGGITQSQLLHSLWVKGKSNSEVTTLLSLYFCSQCQSFDPGFIQTTIWRMTFSVAEDNKNCGEPPVQARGLL